ncbi:ribonuclease III [Tessaracoccus sp. SD287]|uniref:ribonuclease III n=1 Tax=Tessaracoccus sp. SD287 TaxID=2782008 RepID=UPI001A966B86|nr:ribonuclease III [Tessaracoccus sp. SD287]MBO1031743.1 ribonuclease III [Tessaracoccus sp. SD287]
MSRFQELLQELGVPIDAQLLALALTHRSWAYENGNGPHNERLEFLGDAVLEIVVTEHLYLAYPDLPEGQLAKMRAAVVNAHSLAGVARGLGIGPMIKLGHGEVTTRGADKSSILADTTEALIGAIHLSSGGAEASATFVRHLFVPLVETAAALGPGLDWKTSLQEVCAAQGLGVPSYEVSQSGPDHLRRYVASVVVDGKRRGTGDGTSKRLAETRAAEVAYRRLTRDAANQPERG